MIQFDLFEQPGEWSLNQKGDAMPAVSIEVERVAGGWGYGASWWSRKGMCGGGFGVANGRTAPTRAEAIAAALEWIERHLSRYPPEFARFDRWRRGVA